jgi:hypothetical protein
MTKKPGRPAKLNDDAKATLIRALGLGISEADAARIVAVSPRTVRREAEADANFAQDKKRATIAGKMRLLQRITDASEQHWQAAAWLLERRFWKEFARRRPDALTPEEVAALAADLVAVALRFIPEESRQAFREAVRAELGKSRGRPKK